MKINCPHCGGALDVGDRLIGDRVLHPRCNGWLLVARRADGSCYGVKVQGPAKVYKQVQRGE